MAALGFARRNALALRPMNLTEMQAHIEAGWDQRAEVTPYTGGDLA